VPVKEPECRCGFGRPDISEGEQHIAKTIDVQYKIGLSMVSAVAAIVLGLEWYYTSGGGKISAPVIIPWVGFILSLAFGATTSLGTSFTRMDAHIRQAHIPAALQPNCGEAKALTEADTSPQTKKATPH
jgi:hypothetical protein